LPAFGDVASPVFVDASAWLATANGRDRYHAVARAVLDACRAQRVQLVTTTWTAYEAISILKSREGSEAVARLWSLLTQSAFVNLVYVTREIEERALNLFLGFGDKTWGVVDCANLIVMEDLGCQQAFGFDHHFVEASSQRGFQVLP
jgi:predicted nucleic acid-binding protein